MVGSDISVLASMYFTWYSCELIPDGRAASILVRCTLNLIGCRCSTPEKIYREDRGYARVNRRSWLRIFGYAHTSSYGGPAINGGPTDCGGPAINGGPTTWVFS